MPARNEHEEDRLQIACVRQFEQQHPDLARLLHHSPNGGKRTKFEAVRFKQMGTRAGFPDLILLKPSEPYAYLCVELKTLKGDQSDDQRSYQEEITKAGGLYVVIRTVEDFDAVVNAYLQGQPIPELKAPKRTTKKTAKFADVEGTPAEKKPRGRKKKAPDPPPAAISIPDFFRAGGVCACMLNRCYVAPVYDLQTFRTRQEDRKYNFTFQSFSLQGHAYEKAKGELLVLAD